MQAGQVVISKAGRDKGYYLVVVSCTEEAVYVADGRERPLGRPKRKKPRHLAPTAMHLDAASMAGNRALRKALRALAEGSRDRAEAAG